jgi:hypothetical protein
MTGQEMLQRTLRESRTLGLLAYHCYDSRRDQGDSGFPDIVIAGPGEVIFWELKGSSDDLRPAQRRYGTGEDPIPEPECWHLLATSAVGRIALSPGALPAILPVQYYLTGHTLAVCLGHSQLPEHALDQAVVAFSADSIDRGTRSGWSVQIQGRSVIPPLPPAAAQCGWPAPSVWPSAGRHRTAPEWRPAAAPRPPTRDTAWPDTPWSGRSAGRRP